MKENYQKKLERLLENPQTRGKRLFLHCCCAPCSSSVLEYLGEFFSITVFYYNPNITDKTEYQKRAAEQKRLIDVFNRENPCRYPIRFEAGSYEPDLFFRAVKGHETDKEGGERCSICFELRLKEAAMLAAAGGYDYYTTTLTISPLKDAQRLNEIGARCAKTYGVAFLPSDFKKNDGYKRSVELSKKYDLYRQNYCGCVFSRNEGKDE